MISRVVEALAKVRSSRDIACGSQVTVLDGECEGKNVVIVDDLVQTGGTLFECGKALKELGAKKVACFVAHGVFPNASWKKFAKGGDRDVFYPFWLSNSIPTVSSTLPPNDNFRVLDILPQIIADL
eukprot:11715-Prorocentrum_minimum.AAC.3